MNEVRVLAFICVENDVVHSLGEGNYVGDFVIPEEIAVEMPAYPKGLPVPKIELDSGDVVWGCECWWGAIEQVMEKLCGYEFKDVNISDYRNGKNNSQ